MFGSVLKKGLKDAGDLDLLVLYRGTPSLEQVDCITTLLESTLSEKFGTHADIVMLSLQEEKQVGFIESEGAVCFKKWQEGKVARSTN